MKLQIIELDAQDDRASIRDRLAWSQAPRVVLVFPNRGRTRLSRLDLVLLHREAAHRGRELGLATRHPVVQAAAEAAGVATFPSLDDVPEGSWARPATAVSRLALHERGSRSEGLPPRPPDTIRTARGLHRWVWIGVAGISLLALAAAVIPRAEVVLVPVQQARQQTIALAVSPTNGAAQPEADLKSRQMEVSLDGSLRLPTSGSALAPDSPSRGEALFTNLGGEAVAIPEGTSLRASEHAGTRFITTVVAELPGGQGSTVSVPIEAAEAGSAGNLPSDSLDSIDGPLGLQASV